MPRKTISLPIASLDQVPSLDTLRAIPRDQEWILVFEGKVQAEREKIGESLKKELQGFQIGVHLQEPRIRIAKLITNEEIDAHQDFFESCAKDYRSLGTALIFKMVKTWGLDLNEEIPLKTFNYFAYDHGQSGRLDDWNYFIHGIHIGFEHNKTGQEIEVPLSFGLEFGDLDPYFFTRYIKSTPAFQPLPVEIYEDYWDGKRINQRMLELGKFEKIPSKMKGLDGIVVRDREEISR